MDFSQQWQQQNPSTKWNKLLTAARSRIREKQARRDGK